MQIRRTLLLALSISCLGSAIAAQEGGTIAQRRTALDEREAYRELVNENTLFLMSGQPDTTYMALAHDISIALDDGAHLRVIPVVGNEAVQNVSDVLFLRGIDLSFTMVPVVGYLKRTKQYGANFDRQLVYIAVLENDELHVLARRGFDSLEQLAGKTVNFHTAGSATALLGPRIFAQLGIKVSAVNMPQGDAIENMRAGEIAATVCMCAKPVNFLSEVRRDDDFRLLDVPFAPSLQDDYLPASIDNGDYPNLKATERGIETIAATSILISFNWPRGSTRYNRNAKFVDAFFSKLSELQKPPRHPMWRSVNLAATISELQRFVPAQEWLDRNTQSASARAGLKGIPSPSTAGSDALYREFMSQTRKNQ